jgi:uncharacterized protein (TIGR03083 family)
LPTVEQSDPIQLVADEQPRLSGELRHLPPDAWSALSRCEGWSNARTLAHLTLGSLLYHQSVTRALNGDTSPPAAPDGREMALEDLRQLFTNRQEEWARKPSEELLDLFDQHGLALADLFRGLSPADPDKPAWHPFGTITIGTFVGFRAFELGFHGWDIRASLDPNAAVRAELRPFLLGMVRQAQTRFCRPEPDLQGAFRCEVDRQAWAFRASNGALADAPVDTAADATVKTDANSYLLLATSRRSLPELSGRVTVAGDRRQAERFLGAARFRI